MLRTLTAAAVACAILGAPAQAQAPPATANALAATDADIRCLLVVAIFASQVTDADQKTGAVGGLGYFIGKIKGREPTIDLRARLVGLASGLDQSTMRPEFVRCGDEMKAFGVESTELGQAMQSLATRNRPAT